MWVKSPKGVIHSPFPFVNGQLLDIILFNQYKMSKAFDIDDYQSKLLGGILRPDKSIFININNSLKNLIHNTFLVASTSYFNLDWFEKSMEYTRNLSNNEKYILFSYTHTGDRVINMIIREPEKKYDAYKILLTMKDILIAPQLFSMFPELYSDDMFMNTYTLSMKGKETIHTIMETNKLLDITLPSFNVELMDKVVKICIDDLRRIIYNGPRNDKTMILFRGIKSDYLTTSDIPKELKGFQSTTYNIEIAKTFKECCIYEFVLMPNTPCIVLEDTSDYFKEREILIDTDVYAIVYPLEDKFELDVSNFFSESLDIINTNILSSNLNFKFSKSKDILNIIVNPELSDEKIPTRRCILGHPTNLTKPLEVRSNPIEYIVKVNKKTLKKSRRSLVNILRGRRTFRRLKTRQQGSGFKYDEYSKYKDGGIKVVEDAIIPPEVIEEFRVFVESLKD